MRARTNVGRKERRTLTLSEFRGVDFSTPAMRVQSNRARFARNLINEYGVNKKRSGWRELFRLDGEINGMFEIFGERKELIVYAGNRFFRVSDGGEKISELPLPAGAVLKSGRIQTFRSNGSVYVIGCGDFLVYGRSGDGDYTLRRVENDSETYIPTTTVNINADGTEGDVRATLDDVNILSARRINRLVGVKQGENIEQKWTLDTAIDKNTRVEIRLEAMRDGALDEVRISNMLGAEGRSGYYTELCLCDTEECVGQVDFDLGRISLSCDTEPPVENRDNIFVTFFHDLKLSNRITECNFGTLFGVEGNTDRLFLSGNAALPNMDFHSEEGDFSYFTDRGFATLGSDASAIKGYGRLSDSYLAVYKEACGQESSLFYRTGHYEVRYDEHGNIESRRASFPAKAGSVGEGCISTYASLNLAGDSLILSENGVFGVVLTSNVATTERYTRERSRNINERLLRHGSLSDAVAAVYQNRYYLAVDGVCYVADSRYKFYVQNGEDSSFNYEWWYWDNIPARVFAVVENQLYFGTADGRVAVFDGKYSDRTYIDTKLGEVSPDGDGQKIICSRELLHAVSDGDTLKFSDGVYSLLSASATVREGRVQVGREEIFSYREGDELYFDAVLSEGVPYTVLDVDVGACSFSLRAPSGEMVSISASGLKVYSYLSGEELYITDIDASDASFRLSRYKNGATIRIGRYCGRVPTDLTARITHYSSVVAEWYTPVFDLGTNGSSKTLLKMTVSTEPEINGRLSFGYETRNTVETVGAKGINVFSLDSLSFENFSFDTAFANSYSVRTNERNFNFIAFRFYSDNDCDLRVNNLTVVYKINKSNRGVS